MVGYRVTGHGRTLNLAVLLMLLAVGALAADSGYVRFLPNDGNNRLSRIRPFTAVAHQRSQGDLADDDREWEERRDCGWPARLHGYAG